MKKGHFRLTCVAQKRCCLSSLFRRRGNLVPRFSLLKDGYDRILGTRLAVGKFSQNPRELGNYFQESNDGLWNWISLKYSDQSTPFFSSIVLWPTWLNHTHSGFSFKDLFPLLMIKSLWLLKQMPSLAVLKVHGSARGLRGWFTNRFTQKC